MVRLNKKMKTKRLKEIEERIEIIEEIIDVKDKQYWDSKTIDNVFSKDWDAYQKYVSAEQKELSDLGREQRMLMPYTLEDIPTYGDVMTLKKFISCVKSGGFIDYDGFGNYVKDNKVTNIQIYPSDVKHNSIRKEFDTIVWYNR